MRNGFTESVPMAEAEAIAGFFRALADPTRVRILNFLAAGELCVCDLVELLGQPQSTTSRHLACLRDDGLVQVRREGRFAYYAPQNPGDLTLRLLYRVTVDGLDTADTLARERARAGELSRARMAAPCKD